MSSTNKTSHYNLPQFIGSDIPTWLGDINSAMTAIDSGINAAATAASGAATDAAAAQKSANDALKAANRCPFPIGYGGFFQTDPNSIYAGTTWEQKKDVFILASGNTYGAGSTGGEAQHILRLEELPGTAVVSSALINGKNVYGRTQVASDNSWYAIANEEYEPSNSGKAHNNMPPYFAMPFWVRTA